MANKDLKTVKDVSCIEKKRTISTWEDCKNAKKISNEVLPHQDQGYAWVVVFAMFLYCLVLGGTYKAFGVIYMGLNDLFQAGEFRTSLVNVIYSLCSCLGSLVTGWLSDKFPLRIIVVVGSIIAAMGLAIASFATNIYLVIVGYGVLAGSASACFDSPLMCAMAQYWNKRKALANGIGYSGTSLGTLLFPIIYSLLMDVYTVRGALLLAGGFWLHIAISGMLLRPPPEYKPKKARPKFQLDRNMNETVLNVNDLKNCDNIHGENLTDEKIIYEIMMSKTLVVDETIEAASCAKNVEEIISEISSSVRKLESQNDLKMKVDRAKELGYKDILTNLQFIRHLVMTGLSTFSGFSILFLMPSLAVEWGASDLTASLTVTVSGAAELIARLSMGYLIDRFNMNKVRLWSACSLLIGLVGVAVAFSGQVSAVLILGAMLGMCGTVVTPMMVPIMSECIPPELLGRASGILLFLFGVGPAVGYAIVGQMTQVTGSYVDSLLLFSFVFFFVFVSGFSDVINSITQRIFRKKQKSESSEKNSQSSCDIEKSFGQIGNNFENRSTEQYYINPGFEEVISTWL